MEFNKPVSNPMLVGCIELLKAEDTPKYRSMFMTELQKSCLLAPVRIDPAPEEDEEGNLRIIPGSSIQFPMLLTKDGRKFFMGFTDDREYQLWVEKNQPCPTFSLVFDDYIGMMLRKDPEGNTSQAEGIVVNPFGSNMMVHKDMLAQVMAGRMIHALQQGEERPAQKLRIPAPSDKGAPATGEVDEGV